MVLDNDWGIPALESIKVTEDELLLLDWVMCSGSQLIPNAPLEDLVTNWSSFRVDVWKGISTINRFNKNLPVTENLAIDEFLARTLLALVPTTFRWGTGTDCGYELKLKLYRFLANDGELTNDDTQNQANSDSQDESTGTT
jgi:hypothetical protein